MLLICSCFFFLFLHGYFTFVQIFWAQIVLQELDADTAGDKKDLDSIGLGLSLDSGLGVFDAFFASLSMIIVSEVCSYFIVLFFLLLFLCRNKCCLGLAVLSSIFFGFNFITKPVIPRPRMSYIAASYILCVFGGHNHLAVRIDHIFFFTNISSQESIKWHMIHLNTVLLP